MAVVAVCGAATEVKTAVCLAEDSVATAGVVAVASSGGVDIVLAGRASAWVATAACLTVFFGAPKSISSCICTIFGCDGGNRTRNSSEYLAP